MITALCYTMLEVFTSGWEGWFLVLPVLLDLAIIARVGGKDVHES